MIIHKLIAKSCIIAAFSFFCTNATSQLNLVPNSSFEQNSKCPSINSENTFTVWSIASSFRKIVYYNVCDTVDKQRSIPTNSMYALYGGYQYAHSGNAYVAVEFINSYDRGYIQVKLLDSLKKGHRYYAEHFVNTPNVVQGGCNDIGMLFTDTVFYADTNYLGGFSKVYIATPQILGFGNPIIIDTLNWVKIGGIYTAKGGEQYLTLGNFDNYGNTKIKRFQTAGYGGVSYLIDDVSVYDLDSFRLQADAGRDTVITKGDSAWIGSYTNGIDTIQWLQNGVTIIDTLRPGFWVYPTTNTYYVLTQTVNGYTSLDTVWVTVQPLPVSIKNYELKIKNGIQGEAVENVWETSTEINTAYFNVQRSVDGITFYTIGKVNAKGAGKYSFIDNTNLTGVVYYRLEIVDKNGNKTYSEIRSVLLTHPNSQFTITPNPAKDYITINAQNIKEVSISDASGRVLIVDKENKIDISSLSAGIYYITIKSLDGQWVVKKLVKY